ncbi:hypothetical protein BC832DRAFT_589052 [Gaertneriomyces semiglobifer]|nr:hypothetical protein BC832DRAFT_589052 [Gaertneriomyces semiglobifer]
MAEHENQDEIGQKGVRKWWSWGFGGRPQCTTREQPLVPWMETTSAASTSTPPQPTSTSPTTAHVTSQIADKAAGSTLFELATENEPASSALLSNASTLSSTSTPDTPIEPTTSPATTDFRQYNKYIIGAASLTAFGSMIYTIRRETKKAEMKMPPQDLVVNPAAAAANPKLTGYLFAGRALATATLITVTGFIGITMAMASAMQVNSIKEFSDRMREIISTRFPQLRVADPDADSKFDPAYHEFLKFMSNEKEDDEGTGKENAGHAIIGNRVQT